MSANSVPLLKAPVWTWEVPTYLFVGGVAGVGAVIALIAELTNGDPSLARDARFVALAGGLISPLLLIADLGRPSRFLYMLRVFKLRSAMSVGAWALAGFGGAITAAIAVRGLFPTDADSSWLPAALILASDLTAALTGLILVTYTGVLLGTTAIPVWAANARVLPWLFTASSLGACASLLELIGHRVSPLHLLAIVAAAVEIAASLGVTGLTKRSAALRTSELLVGAIPLVLRLLAPIWPWGRTLAGVSAIAGALLSRIAWIAAGRASAAQSRG